MKIKVLFVVALLLTTFAVSVDARVRSRTAIQAFKRAKPCPVTHKRFGPCPGYIIDHIRPLACGGADQPVNMQWMTKHDALIKDKWERKEPGCPGIACPSFVRISGVLIDLCKTTPVYAGK